MCVISSLSLSLSLSTYAPVKQFLRVDKDKVCIFKGFLQLLVAAQ